MIFLISYLDEYLNLGNAGLEPIDVAFVLLELLDKGQSNQVLFPKPVVVIDGFAEVSFFVDVAQVDTKVKRCLVFLVG